MRSGASEVLGYAAEALLLAGDYDAAHLELQEAFRVGEELGERVYLGLFRFWGLRFLPRPFSVDWQSDEPQSHSHPHRRAVRWHRRAPAQWRLR